MLAHVEASSPELPSGQEGPSVGGEQWHLFFFFSIRKPNNLSLLGIITG